MNASHENSSGPPPNVVLIGSPSRGVYVKKEKLELIKTNSAETICSQIVWTGVWKRRSKGRKCRGKGGKAVPTGSQPAHSCPKGNIKKICPRQHLCVAWDQESNRRKVQNGPQEPVFHLGRSECECEDLLGITFCYESKQHSDKKLIKRLNPLTNIYLIHLFLASCINVYL